MKQLLKYRHSFFIVKKIFARISDIGDKEKMIQMIQDDISYAGDPKVKKKCQSMIN